MSLGSRTKRLASSVLLRAGWRVERANGRPAGGGGPTGQSRRWAGRPLYDSLSALSTRYGYHRSNLTAAEAQVFSQNGEDGVIAEMLDRVGVQEQFFVEFGIGKGRVGNCVFLADVLGWSGLFIESDSPSFSSLCAKYRHNPRVATLHSMVTPENIDQLFTEAGCPEDVDVVSIDVDGQDYWLWKSLSSVRPRIVVIEYNSGLPADEELVEPRGTGGWDKTDYFGASIAALVTLGRAKGYTLAHLELAGINAFFVRDDLRDKLGDVAPILRTPNYWLLNLSHPVDPHQRPYVRLTDGA